MDGTRGGPPSRSAENWGRRDGIRAGSVSGPWRSAPRAPGEPAGPTEAPARPQPSQTSPPAPPPIAWTPGGQKPAAAVPSDPPKPDGPSRVASAAHSAFGSRDRNAADRTAAPPHRTGSNVTEVAFGPPKPRDPFGPAPIGEPRVVALEGPAPTPPEQPHHVEDHRPLAPQAGDPPPPNRAEEARDGTKLPPQRTVRRAPAPAWRPGLRLPVIAVLFAALAIAGAFFVLRGDPIPADPDLVAAPDAVPAPTTTPVEDDAPASAPPGAAAIPTSTDVVTQAPAEPEAAAEPGPAPDPATEALAAPVAAGDPTATAPPVEAAPVPAPKSAEPEEFPAAAGPRPPILRPLARPAELGAAGPTAAAAAAASVVIRVGPDMDTERRELIVAALISAGYGSVEVQPVSFNVARSRLGFFRNADREMAEELVALIAPLVGEVAVRNYNELLADPAPGRLDLWLRS